LRRGHQSSVTVRTVDNAWIPGALMLDAPKCIRAQQNAWPSGCAEKIKFF
jgi:hypothetical protein